MQASIRNQRIPVTGGKVGYVPLCVAAVSVSPQELQGGLYRCKKTGDGEGKEGGHSKQRICRSVSALPEMPMNREREKTKGVKAAQGRQTTCEIKGQG
jgi:hypothetical protein